MTDPTNKGTASHEAGHAVMAIKMGIPFQHVTIVPYDDSVGHVLYGTWLADFDPDPNSATSRDLLYRLGCVTLAGPLAEGLYSGQPELGSGGAQGDRDHIIHLAFRSGMLPEETEAWLKWLTLHVARPLESSPIRKAIVGVSEQLENQLTLQEDAVERVCRSCGVMIPEKLDLATLQEDRSAFGSQTRTDGK
jgi:hypothetical protein